MNYNSKNLPKKIASNDAALFPDNDLATDRKRRKSVKKLPKPLIAL